jgi:DNA-binding protein YbaB
MGVFDNVKDMSKLKKMADDAKKVMEEIRATGLSKRGYVKVALDGEKHLKNIEFSPEAMKITPDELAKCTKEAHRAATKEVDKLVKKQMKNSGLNDLLMGKK